VMKAAVWHQPAAETNLQVRKEGSDDPDESRCS
jgi:hypothetical protein